MAFNLDDLKANFQWKPIRNEDIDKTSTEQIKIQLIPFNEYAFDLCDDDNKCFIKWEGPLTRGESDTVGTRIHINSTVMEAVDETKYNIERDSFYRWTRIIHPNAMLAIPNTLSMTLFCSIQAFVSLLNPKKQQQPHQQHKWTIKSQQQDLFDELSYVAKIASEKHASTRQLP